MTTSLSIRAMLAAATILGLAPTARVATARQDAPQLTPAKSVRAPHCSLKGAKTVKANRYVRVFKRTSRGFGSVYGCRRGARRAFELGSTGECQNNDDVQKVELSGRRAVLGIFESAR